VDDAVAGLFCDSRVDAALAGIVAATAAVAATSAATTTATSGLRIPGASLARILMSSPHARGSGPDSVPDATNDVHPASSL
jgi:hypothetical protein